MTPPGSGGLAGGWVRGVGIAAAPPVPEARMMTVKVRVVESGATGHDSDRH